ncbi:hypothetical protein [Salininema proteolyticum]|uniref:Uncharacterized protein n=1 Tax=Salininema proteolyticum TaxID=1607685 RepID=A0ABV8TX57_9ACTN
MEHSDHFKATMRAIALDRPSDELVSQIPDDAQEDWATFVAAMFAAVIGQVFEHDQSHEAVKKFVSEMRYGYRELDTPISALALEGLLRGMLGEEHLLDEVTPEEQFRLQILSIRKVVNDVEQVNTNLEAYLADAVTLAESLAE